MGTSHERKSLIPDETPKAKSAKSTGDSSDSSGKIRVIAMTSVFVVLLAYVTYRYGFADREVPEPAADAQETPTQQGKPNQQQPTAPPPPELQRERHDVIQG